MVLDRNHLSQFERGAADFAEDVHEAFDIVFGQSERSQYRVLSGLVDILTHGGIFVVNFTHGFLT